MKLPQTGGCQCGAIRYEITEEPQQVYACHCRDCQRLTSSAFSRPHMTSKNSTEGVIFRHGRSKMANRFT